MWESAYAVQFEATWGQLQNVITKYRLERVPASGIVREQFDRSEGIIFLHLAEALNPPVSQARNCVFYNSFQGGAFFVIAAEEINENSYQVWFVKNNL